jgi:uncharacterized protein (TIGR00369 family)
VSENEQTRLELVKAFIPHSPHAKALGISIEEIEIDRAVLAMPFKEELATMGDVVHGGAISTLMDTAATVAAWATDDVPDSPAGATVSLSINFILAARGCDLRAEGMVVRRGRKLSFCAVEAQGPGGTLIASGIATYTF